MARATVAEIRKAILKDVPGDGSAIGNQRLRELVAARLSAKVNEDDYFEARDALVANGKLAKGQGRGGSVRRLVDEAPALTLKAIEVPAAAQQPKPKQAALPIAPRKPGQPPRPSRKGDEGVRVIAYQHDQKRTNNPDVGVVTPETDPEQPKTAWAYDQHIDPALQFDTGRAQIESLIDDALASGNEAAMRDTLQTLKRMAAPYLNWAGKAERTSFEIDTVSLHVHERIDPATILRAVQKRMKDGTPAGSTQGDMFRAWFEDPLPYREAIEFYRHDRGWSNRLIAGDSLLVMNSLLQKEGMAGQVQMIYIDPPYGIKYGSNFQPFVNKRDVAPGDKDEDLTKEPEMIKAFRDTWELGIHSYLTYLRDRLLLARKLLHESGSVFVQISQENVHLARNLMDEIFGAENFGALIAFQKTSGSTTTTIPRTCDYIVWYAKSLQELKFRKQYVPSAPGGVGALEYKRVELRDGTLVPASHLSNNGKLDLPEGARIFATDSVVSKGGNDDDIELCWGGQEFVLSCRPNRHWKPGVRGIRRLWTAGRLLRQSGLRIYKRYFDDFPFREINHVWLDTRGEDDPSYVVQTHEKVIERCILMTTDPSDLVLDPTCGSGTAALVSERWGRRWITCDTSRVAVTLAKQRLMTASFDYFELKYPHEGLRGGFVYRRVPHVTLGKIASNVEIDEIWERMHPAIEQTLADLNTALLLPSPSGRGAGGEGTGSPIRFTITEGGRKGQTLTFGTASSAGKTRTLTPPPLPGGEALEEWEVPFDLPADWPTNARAAFDAFHAARQAMQRKLDASIAAHADQETLFDQPQVAKDKLRITGPFTVEAVPFPTVLALDESRPLAEADASIARSGESSRQHRWRDELLKTGIRGKGGQMLKFAELETLPDTRHLHCSGHLDSGERVVVSFGPEHAALEQRQVELAMREAGELFPRPKMIVFCAFTFDPEAAKDIDVTKGITALKAQMNTDLLTDDLKKARSNNQSFWLMGQPDVEVRQRKDGKWEVEVNGFDYFDPTATDDAQRLVSGGKGKIAAWALDTDYDERSLFPRQVFFPMAGAKDGWNKLKKDIKAELNEALLDKLHGTVSLPFEPGENRKVAIKIVDDRGIESLKIVSLD